MPPLRGDNNDRSCASRHLEAIWLPGNALEVIELDFLKSGCVEWYFHPHSF